MEKHFSPRIYNINRKERHDDRENCRVDPHVPVPLCITAPNLSKEHY
jgi:hypothetical protein